MGETIDDGVIQGSLNLNKKKEYRPLDDMNILVEKETFLGKITGYTEPGNKHKIYWRLESKGGRMFEIWNASEEVLKYDLSKVMERLKEAVLGLHGF